MLPTISKQGSLTTVYLTDNLTLFFSYETLIGFCHDGVIVARQNEWGVTTGKHLRIISDNLKDRLASEQFEEEYNKLVGNMGK